ncbi:probable intracellular septation protein A [Etheostoma spectabile]|uniref:probable intracellular septation protein A n=1 Tax=Etheostoma spectabile TaxID=54343 RepID=UPI0013AE8946|nr:probable intracellular septation protein A [Etheostoma spectabile]
MFLYMLIFMAYHSSRWIPRNQRLKFQIVNAVFTALVLVPQFYIMGRPKSSRYCKQPLLNNLSASIALSFIASGFSVIFTLIDPVPQSLWASFHVFGLLTCGQGLCTTILTLTAAPCAKTTPELYYISLILTVASILSTGFFMVRGGLWLTNRKLAPDLSRNNEQ